VRWDSFCDTRHDCVFVSIVFVRWIEK
jgi:hypothetical protein